MYIHIHPRDLQFASILTTENYPLQDGHSDHAAERDMGSEYSRQRELLERSVASLRKKLAKDTEIHRKESIRVMQVMAATLWTTVIVYTSPEIFVQDYKQRLNQFNLCMHL